MSRIKHMWSAYYLKRKLVWIRTGTYSRQGHHSCRQSKWNFDHKKYCHTGMPCRRHRMQQYTDRRLTCHWAIHIYIYICFIGSEDHVALDRNPEPGYDTLLLRLIPGDLLSACPHRQIHTLPGLLDSQAALSNSYPNALRAMQGGSLYHFYDGLWYDPAGRRTHDLPCERRTR